MKCDVTLWPSGKVVSVDSKHSLFSELKAQGIGIKSNCGGCATCALCVVMVRAGDEYLNEPSFEEKQLLGNVFHITKERLSCQTYVSGPVTIDITNHLDMPGPIMRKVVRRKPEEKEAAAETVAQAPAPEVKKAKPGGFKRPKKFNFDDSEENS